MTFVINNLLLNSIKRGISASCGIIIANLADPHDTSFFSWHEMHHVLLQIALVVIFTEAVYWKKWADGIKGSGDDDATKPKA